MLTRDKLNELFEQWVCDGARAQRELGWTPEVPSSAASTSPVDVAASRLAASGR